MLVCKIDLHSAITGQQSNLCTLVIANDGTGTPQRGNYNVWKTYKPDPDLKVLLKTAPIGRVENWNRMFEADALVITALRELDEYSFDSTGEENNLG